MRKFEFDPFRSLLRSQKESTSPVASHCLAHGMHTMSYPASVIMLEVSIFLGFNADVKSATPSYS
jgi:hypothetical protein